MKKVSVIIPFYNAEAYIEKCLRSVFAQSEKNLEIILVDDGSSDLSVSKVDSLRCECPGSMSITLHDHEVNRGVSAARNTAIEKATGKYIYFLDSDDWLSVNCFEVLLEQAENNGAEVCSGECEFARSNDDYIRDDSKSFQIYRYPSNIEVLNMFSARSPSIIMACNKLILRDLVIRAGIKFQVNLLHEDNLWNFYVAMHADSWTHIDVKTYFYRRDNPDSITTRMPTNEMLNCYYIILQEMRNEMRSRGPCPPETMKQFAKIIHNFKKSILWIIESGPSPGTRRDYITFRQHDNYWKNNIGYRYLNIKERCFALGWTLPASVIRWANPYYLTKYRGLFSKVRG